MRSLKTLLGVTILFAMVVAAGAPLLTADTVSCAFGSGSGTCFSDAANRGTLDAPSASGTLSNGSYTEQTYLNGSGVWASAFDFTASPNGVGSLSTGFGPLGSESDTLDRALAYGSVADTGTEGGTLTFTPDGGFLPSAFTIEMGSPAFNGQTVEFYGQSHSHPDPVTASSGVLVLLGAAALLASLLIKRKKGAA